MTWLEVIRNHFPRILAETAMAPLGPRKIFFEHNNSFYYIRRMKDYTDTYRLYRFSDSDERTYQWNLEQATTMYTHNNWEYLQHLGRGSLKSIIGHLKNRRVPIVMYEHATRNQPDYQNDEARSGNITLRTGASSNGIGILSSGDMLYNNAPDEAEYRIYGSDATEISLEPAIRSGGLDSIGTITRSIDNSLYVSDGESLNDSLVSISDTIIERYEGIDNALDNSWEIYHGGSESDQSDDE